MTRYLATIFAILFLASCGMADDSSLPEGIRNSQDPKDVPPTPLESLAKITVPEGFNVSLFAGEPDVRQPIAFAIDDRGRLWVAECYSYREWKPEGHDRIVILEDTDGDGRFDKRKVFWDKGNYLSGLELGFGGVWICNSPNLAFIPDRDGDDKPDSEPIILLDGWSNEGVHNVLNGLTWGPDGWLYGCNGITAPSKVGKPGTPDNERIDVNCAIWRYHPTRHKFEVVAHGTTNPWGLDYDEHGQFFFTNCVIGHLWHLIPGAHYKRMFGQDYNPYVYDLIDQHADHLHWMGDDWTKARGGEEHHSLGGGHAHCGAIIYLGDNWPASYRGKIFTCNVHGARVNCDQLVRDGSGFVGRHDADMFFANDPWFRGVELKYGPDGGVYITDWTDLGECHDHDGVHRDSGRIYKVTFGETKFDAALNLAKLPDGELVDLHQHDNEWFVRHARRILHERASSGKLAADTADALRKMYSDQTTATGKLRALWTLHVIGAAPTNFLAQQLAHENENIRWWAIQLLCEESAPDSKVVDQLTAMAKDDSSALVRLGLASVLQRLPVHDRWLIAGNLLSHAEDTDDHNLPLMYWYGVEPLLPADTSKSLQLAVNSRISQVRRYVARRAADENQRGLAALVQTLDGLSDAKVQLDLLNGMLDTLAGQRNVAMPNNWSRVYGKLTQSGNNAVRDRALHLALIFGDGQAISSLLATMMNRDVRSSERTRAIEALVQNQVPRVAPLLHRLLEDRDVRGAALRGLAAYDDAATPQLILKQYTSFSADEKQDAIQTLSSRAAFALALLDALEQKTIPTSDITAYTARQLDSLGDAQITERRRKLWGEIRESPQEKKQQIAEYKQRLTPQTLSSADLAHGRQLFEKNCMSCHKLYGEGGSIGPDITGGNRDNLDYLLENIIDPSSAVARDYRVTNIITDDGRLVSGIIVAETTRTLTIQTVNQRVIIDRSAIDEMQASRVSMMPDGLADKLSDEEFRDLIAYLAKKQPVKSN